jgi:hypothetical protein
VWCVCQTGCRCGPDSAGLSAHGDEWCSVGARMSGIHASH